MQLPKVHILGFLEPCTLLSWALNISLYLHVFGSCMLCVILHSSIDKCYRSRSSWDAEGVHIYSFIIHWGYGIWSKEIENGREEDNWQQLNFIFSCGRLPAQSLAVNTKVCRSLCLCLNFYWFSKKGKKSQHKNTAYDASEGSHINLFTKVQEVLDFFFKYFLNFYCTWVKEPLLIS